MDSSDDGCAEVPGDGESDVTLTEAEAKQWVAEDLKNMVWHGAKLSGHTPPLFHYEIADFLQG